MMQPPAEHVHWLFATGFLLLALCLLARAIVGVEVWNVRAWRAYLWPSLLFGLACDGDQPARAKHLEPSLPRGKRQALHGPSLTIEERPLGEAWDVGAGVAGLYGGARESDAQ